MTGTDGGSNFTFPVLANAMPLVDAFDVPDRLSPPRPFQPASSESGSVEFASAKWYIENKIMCEPNTSLPPPEEQTDGTKTERGDLWEFLGMCVIGYKWWNDGRKQPKLMPIKRAGVR